MARTLAIAEMIAPEFQVEVVGPMFGTQIWPPYPRARFPLRVFPGARTPLFAGLMLRIARSIRADVIYAFKPLMPSLGTGLLHRYLRGTPVVLDLDDDELSLRPPAATVRGTAVDALHPLGRGATRIAVSLARRADAVTVATTLLERSFGGVLVPHPRDTAHIRPRPEISAEIKHAIGAGDRRVVMFAGTPRPHKGVEDVAAAVRMLKNDALFVIVGGDTDDPYLNDLLQTYPETLILPNYPYEEAGTFLQAADVVVVPQRQYEKAAKQLPAKLLDAMAAGKPIVATVVGDLSWILAEGRGRLVPPEDPAAIANAIDALFADRSAAATMAAAAREWCVRHASYDALRNTVVSILNDAIERRQRAAR